MPTRIVNLTPNPIEFLDIANDEFFIVESDNRLAQISCGEVCIGKEQFFDATHAKRTVPVVTLEVDSANSASISSDITDTAIIVSSHAAVILHLLGAKHPNVYYISSEDCDLTEENGVIVFRCKRLRRIFDI